MAVLAGPLVALALGEIVRRALPSSRLSTRSLVTGSAVLALGVVASAADGSRDLVVSAAGMGGALVLIGVGLRLPGVSQFDGPVTAPERPKFTDLDLTPARVALLFVVLILATFVTGFLYGKLVG